MNAEFAALAQDAVAEFDRRVPGFLRERTIAVGPVEALLDRFADRPIAAAFGLPTIERKLAAGLDILDGLGVRLRRSNGSSDPLSLVLVDSMIDAFAAEDGILDLRAAPTPEGAFERTVETQFECREASAGRRYFISARGSIPLLVVTAHGVPASPWHLLAADTGHDYKIILFESRSSSIFSGGMRPGGSIDTDLEDIAAILEREALPRIALLSWCSGGRVIIEFALRHPSRVASLILLSPTVHGIAGGPSLPSQMEDSLITVFNAIANRPKLAEHFVTAFRDRVESLDWLDSQDDLQLRAAEFSNLPARSHTSTLVQPFVSADSLVNYGIRIRGDISCSAVQKLTTLDTRLLLITGDADKVVNNDNTRSALAHHAGQFTEIRVSGAGHYVHDLQYRYFRLILDRHLRGLEPPRLASRLNVFEKNAD